MNADDDLFALETDHVFVQDAGRPLWMYGRHAYATPNNQEVEACYRVFPLKKGVSNIRERHGQVEEDLTGSNPHGTRIISEDSELYCMDDVPLRLFTPNELETGEYNVYVYLSKKASGDPYTQSVNVSFIWAPSEPPQHLQPPISEVRSVDSRFDLLSLFWDRSQLQQDHNFVPLLTVGLATGKPQSGSSESIRSVNWSPFSLEANWTDQEDSSKAEVKKDSETLSWNENDDFYADEHASSHEGHQLENVSFKGLGGGVVVVGCSTDTDTSEMLRVIVQELKTEDRGAGVEAARSAVYLCDTCASNAGASTCDMRGWCVVGAGLESCGHAVGLEWIEAPWWGFGNPKGDFSAEYQPEGISDMEVFGDREDRGGGLGFVYLVAGSESPSEYAEYVIAWRELLRDGGIIAGSHYFQKSRKSCLFSTVYQVVGDYQQAWKQVFGPEARDATNRIALGDGSDEDLDAQPAERVLAARMCGIKDQIDALVAAAGGWLGVTLEAKSRSWYWMFRDGSA